MAQAQKHLHYTDFNLTPHVGLGISKNVNNPTIKFRNMNLVGAAMELKFHLSDRISKSFLFTSNYNMQRFSIPTPAANYYHLERYTIFLLESAWVYNYNKIEIGLNTGFCRIAAIYKNYSDNSLLDKMVNSNSKKQLNTITLGLLGKYYIEKNSSLFCRVNIPTITLNPYSWRYAPNFLNVGISYALLKLSNQKKINHYK